MEDSTLLLRRRNETAVSNDTISTSLVWPTTTVVANNSNSNNNNSDDAKRDRPRRSRCGSSGGCSVWYHYCIHPLIIISRRIITRSGGGIGWVFVVSCGGFTLTTIAAALCYYYLLPKLIPGPHSVLEDIFWRAVWLMPISYLKIHWWDALPTTAHYVYELTNQNTFVINLDSDTHRWDHFRQKNHGLGTRFSAMELSTERFAVDTALANQIAQFPNVQQLVSLGRYGEAGLYISQIRLLEHILQLNLDYATILEDDALFVHNKQSKNNNNNNTTIITQVQGPAPVDVIFLTAHISRATRLSVQGKTMIRVMGGSGTYGYLVTRRGVQKILTMLRRGSCGWFDRLDSCRKDALDIAMMKYGARYNLQIYLPTMDWPLVDHANYLGSTKNHRNKQGSSSVRTITTATSSKKRRLNPSLRRIPAAEQNSTVYKEFSK